MKSLALYPFSEVFRRILYDVLMVSRNRKEEWGIIEEDKIVSNFIFDVLTARVMGRSVKEVNPVFGYVFSRKCREYEKLILTK